MKHLILDINIVLDMWLKRSNYQVIDHMRKRCGELTVKVWFPSSGLGTASYVLAGELTREGAPKKEAKEISRQLVLLLLEDVSMLSCFGFEQHLAVQEDQDLENAQIALAAGAINGEKKLVTLDKAFDTLGLIATAAPTEAWEWINQETGDQPVALIDLKAQQDATRPGSQGTGRGFHQVDTLP